MKETLLIQDKPYYLSERVYTLTFEDGTIKVFGNLLLLVLFIAPLSKYHTIRRGVLLAAKGGFEAPYYVFDGKKIQEGRVHRHKKTKRN